MAVAPDQATSQTFYTSLGKVDYTLDALGRKTSYSYDILGQMTGTTYPDGTSTSTNYNVGGQRISSTDKAGRMSASVYDSLGRTVMSGPVSSYPMGGSPVWLMSGATPLVSTTVYDDAGQVTSSKDALGHGGGSTYDNLGRTLASTDALGSVTKYVYDDAGRQKSVTDAGQHTTTYDYDLAGRMVATHYPDKSTSSTVYDDLGRRISQTDQANHTTSYTYDTLGRLFTVTDPMSHVTTFGYDALGEKTSQTDANGHITSFAYDNRGRLLSKTLPGGQFDARTYDTLGRLSTMTDFNGKVTAFAYDLPTGRLVSKSAYASAAAYASNTPTGEGVSFTYNLLDGSRKTATRTTPSGSVATTYTYYGYDTGGNPVPDFRQGQLQSVTTTSGGVSRTISYDYDVLGNKRSMTTPGAKTIGYGYDLLNRLSTVTHPGGAITTFGYDKVGNRQSVTRQTSTGVTFSTTGYTYDPLNRLTDIVNKNGSNAVVSSYHYQLRADGKRSSVTDGTGTTNYTYDDQGKLTQEAGPYATIAYTYDNVGNRLTRTVTNAAMGNGTTLGNGPTNTAYDQNDRIVGHTYDANGSETTVNGQAASYDFVNHLIALGSVASYVYDADGNRYSVSNVGTTTSYTVDTSLPYASVVEEYSNGTLAARYDYGDDLVRMDRGGGVYYYIYDGLGSTRQLVSTAGLVTDTWGYSAFGELALHTGSTVNPFLFNAQQFDGASGNYYLRARYYDQSVGRFTSQDPFEGRGSDPTTLHRYLYANVDPINNSDPTGEETICGFLASSGIYTSLTATTFSVASKIYSATTILADAFSLYEDYQATGAVETGDIVNLALDLVLPKLGPILFKGIFGRWLCFAAGTPVLMSNGALEPIERIKIGDLVSSRDESTGRTQAKKVVRLFRHQARQTLLLHFRGGGIVETTPTHPFYVKGEGFVAAGQLAIGTCIVTRAGPCGILERVIHRFKSVTVYNFEVEDFHTYFVGKDKLWVHNDCGAIAAKIAAKVSEKFGNLDCVPCAEALVKAFKFKKLPGKVIELDGGIGLKRSNIISHTLGNQVISDSGRHIGVEVEGMVYDNIHKAGIPYQDWLDDFEALIPITAKVTSEFK